MKEEQIRPQKIFDKYIKLAIKDTSIFFNKNTIKSNINCIACNKKGKSLFVKHNFTYALCFHCFSIYVSPRPNQKIFFDYYLNSNSSKYWASTFYKKTEKSRKNKLWKPKAKKIMSILKKYFLDKKTHVVDIGGGYGTFGDEIKKFNENISIIEPAPHLADICKSKGHDVINKFLENIKKSDLTNKNKLFVSFELIEHLHSPKKFFHKMRTLLSKNDIFVFTTLSGMGLDIAVLGNQSKSIMPPYHLNFFNPYSIKIFLANNGFELLELSTPGKLDIDILNNNFEKINNLFWQYILKTSDDKYLKTIQNIISKKNLSSHMMVICKINEKK